MQNLTRQELARLTGFSGVREARRLITRSGTRLRGSYPPVRFNQRTQWESLLECRLVLASAVSRLVHDFRTQPGTFSVPRPDGTHFDYTPDAALTTIGGELLLVECKPEADCQDPDLKLRLESFAKILGTAKVRLVVATEQHLPQVLHRNLDMVLYAAAWRQSKDARTELESRVRALGDTTFADLQSAVGNYNARHALASRWVFADYFTRLESASPVHTNPEGGRDALELVCAG